MRSTARRLAVGMLVVGLSVGWTLAGSDLWLHVYVEEDGGSGETVRVNVPISLIEEILPLIEHENLKGGKVRLDDQDLEGLDLRALWEAVRDTEDGEFVRVQGEDENVRVAKTEGMLLVEVRGDDEKVDIRVPLEVIDALFSSGTEELDILAALKALGRFPDHDVVSVDDGSSRVRVWIDDRKEMDL